MEDMNALLSPKNLILDAMNKISEGLPFGPANGQRDEMENRFQLELCECLNSQKESSGWEWKREVKYKTQALRNRQGISIDILGMHQNQKNSAAIELKYAPTADDNDGGSDPYAFPYDLLKDCLKIELISTGACEPVVPTPRWPVTYGYSIGLTNIPSILDRGLQRSWSRFYMNTIFPDRLAGIERPFSFGPCRILTVSARNLHSVIYHPDKMRHHISLGSKWNGQWKNFGATGFKFVMLSSAFGGNCPTYAHELDNSEFIPFLTEKSRVELQRNVDFYL